MKAQLLVDVRQINEARKLIEQIEDDLEDMPPEGGGDLEGGGDDMAVDMPPPSEPPIGDEAVGADTEGNVALQLLGDIKELLTQLVAVEGGEVPGEEGELPDEGELPEEGEAVDAVPEAPEDEEAEGQPGGRPPVPA
jgi:hypothetical protein